MKTYRVVRKSDGTLVYQYQSETPIEWSGMGFADHDHVEEPQEIEEIAPEVDARVFGGRRRLTKLEFVALLGAAFTAILAAAKVDVQAEAWVKMVELATPDPDTYSVNLDDPRLEQGLRAFEALSVIEAGTTERVLHG